MICDSIEICSLSATFRGDNSPPSRGHRVFIDHPMRDFHSQAAQKGQVAALVVFACGVLISHEASAHHPPRVSNATPRNVQSSSAGPSLPIQSSVFVEWHRFERFVRNARQKDDVGLDVVSITPQLKLNFASSTDLSFELPASIISQAELVGLNDPTLSIGQALTFNPFRLYVNAGLSMPLGLSKPKELFSVDDLLKDKGELEVVTYNVQAALSAQTPMALALVEGRSNFEIFRFTGDAGLRVQGALPLLETTQGIRFGADLRATIFAAVQRGGFVVAMSAFGEHHFDDAAEKQFFGSRSTLGARAKLGYEFSKRFLCTLQSEMPLWQQAQGAQLLRTLSLGAGCVVGIDP